MGHRLDMRPVGTENDPVSAHVLDDLGDVVLPEGVDPHAPLERLDRIFGEVAGHLASRRGEFTEHVTEEFGSVLDRCDAQIGETIEQLVENQRGEIVVDRPFHVERLDRRLVRRPRELRREPVDGVPIRAIARVAGVDDNRDAGLVGPRPERIEVRVAGGHLTVFRRWRGRPGHDGGRPVGQGKLQLRHRCVNVGQRDVRRGEYAVLVGEAPVLAEPLVERPEHHSDALGVVLEHFLVEHAERGKQPNLADALGVHCGQSGVVVAVRGVDRGRRPQELMGIFAVRIPAEVLRECSGRADRVERRIGHGKIDLAPDHMALTTIDLGPLDDPTTQPGVKVSGEGVDRLVVMVVAVKDGMIEFHRTLLRALLYLALRDDPCAHRTCLVSRFTRRPGSAPTSRPPPPPPRQR